MNNFKIDLVMLNSFGDMKWLHCRRRRKICSGSITIFAFIFHFHVIASNSRYSCIVHCVLLCVRWKWWMFIAQDPGKCKYTFVIVCVLHKIEYIHGCYFMHVSSFGYYVVRMILWGLNWQSNTIYLVREQRCSTTIPKANTTNFRKIRFRTHAF